MPSVTPQQPEAPLPREVSEASDVELRAALRVALAVPRWIDDVAAAAPFSSVDDLLAAARSAAPLTSGEVDEALAHHPRIGEKPRGSDASSAFSRAEQKSADADDERLAAALAEGNRAYEERFGRVFLIRAAGRTRSEILAELHRRLSLGPEAEQQIVGEQLLEIAQLRLTRLFEKGPA